MRIMLSWPAVASKRLSCENSMSRILPKCAGCERINSRLGRRQLKVDDIVPAARLVQPTSLWIEHVDRGKCG